MRPTSSNCWMAGLNRHNSLGGSGLPMSTCITFECPAGRRTGRMTLTSAGTGEDFNIDTASSHNLPLLTWSCSLVSANPRRGKVSVPLHQPSGDWLAVFPAESAQRKKSRDIMPSGEPASRWTGVATPSTSTCQDWSQGNLVVRPCCYPMHPGNDF